MATCARRQAALPPPPPPPLASASVNTHPGKKGDSWLLEPEMEMPIACLPTAIAASDLSKTGKERGSWLPELEMEMPIACPPTAIAAADLAKTGKERGSWSPELQMEMPTACLPTAITAADLAKTGKERGSCLLPEPEKEIEEKEKPLARLAPAIPPGDLTNPVKKPRRPVPMTDEERSKVRHLKELHTIGLKELKELQEERDDLRKDYDQLLFCRRCLYARLVNRIVFHRRDAAYVRHQLDIGLKLGDRLPEELKKARQPISMALFMWSDMGRALELGLDNFLAEYCNPEEHRKRIQREWSTLAGINEGAVREESSSTAQCG